MSLTLFVQLYVLLIKSLNNNAYYFSCPSQGHWKLRAETMCMHQRNYSCLYDVNFQVNVYRDKCIRPRIVGPGYKYVFQPNPNRGTCSLPRYQPFIFNTIGYSDCVYLKSMCNSEGQTTYTSGTTRSDHTCTCNTETGYTFIRNPTNGCYCNPTSEDCSCYIRINPSKNIFVWKDINCDDEVKMKETRLRNDIFNISREMKNHDFDNYKYNINYLPTNEHRIEAARWVLILLLAYFVLGVVGVFLQGPLTRWMIMHRIKEKTGLQETMGFKEQILVNLNRSQIEQKKPVSLNKRGIKEERGLQEAIGSNEQLIVNINRSEIKQKYPVPSKERGIEEERGHQEATGYNEQLILNMNRSEIKQTDPVPPKERDQMTRTIEKWENKKFIPTRAYFEVLAKIGSNSCVAVTGPGGAGKSAIVKTVSLLLSKKNGYAITIISEPKQLIDYYTPGRKTLFVMEDFCGKFTAKQELIERWQEMQSTVDDVIEDESCKILFSCRLQVYKDPMFKLLKKFKSCECNIISADICLTKNEKIEISKSYLGANYITDSILSYQNDNFPLLCQSWSITEKSIDIEKYYETPYQIYEEELANLEIVGKGKLCALCLCVMFNNQLEETCFDKQTKKFRKVIQTIGEKIGLKHKITPTLILEQLNILENTYIIKRDGFYEIFHDACFDFMAHYFGQKMTQCFIKHADSSFLRERFLWEEAFDTQSDEYNIENIVHIGDIHLENYIDRIISDWNLRKVSDALYNINMKSSSFRIKFLSRLNLLDETKARQLSQHSDCFRKDYASGNTPLIISCLGGFVDLVKWLLEHDANVNDCRGDGSSALYMGCSTNNFDLVDILLKNNAHVNLCSKDGVSPLGIACSFHCNEQIVCKLLQKNAEVNQHKLKRSNTTPLFMACQKNSIAVVRALLKHNADPNICASNGMSPLLLACQQNYKHIVRLLIENKADPNTKMQDGDTPLFSASWMGFEDIIKILLDNGANPLNSLQSKEEICKSIEDESHSFAEEKQIWYVAVEDIGSQIVKAYISTKSADYIFDVFAGASPLHVACFMGQIEVIKLLTDKLEKVVDIRKVDGTTPLFYACELGHLDIIRILVDRGADPNINRVDGYSPLTIARINGHTKVLSFLT